MLQSDSHIVSTATNKVDAAFNQHWFNNILKCATKIKRKLDGFVNNN